MLEHWKKLEPERQVIIMLFVLCLAGWITTVSLASYVGVMQFRTTQAEKGAAQWKRQAGKAYTELLTAKAGSGSSAVLVPAGTRIDCNMKFSTTPEGRTIGKCESGLIYPPANY